MTESTVSEIQSNISKVADDLRWYIQTVREKNLDTIRSLIDKGAGPKTWTRYFNSSTFEFTSQEILASFDEVSENYGLNGVKPHQPNWAPTLEQIEQGSAEMLAEVKQNARDGYPEDLQLPMEFKILCAMIESLSGPGLPKHQSNWEFLISFERSEGQEIPGIDGDILDLVEAEDEDGDVEILAGWIIGEGDTSGFYPWAIWCRVVDRDDPDEELKPWGWRYTISSIESGGELCHTLRELFQQIIDLNPEVPELFEED